MVTPIDYKISFIISEKKESIYKQKLYFKSSRRIELNYAWQIVSEIPGKFEKILIVSDSKKKYPFPFVCQISNYNSASILHKNSDNRKNYCNISL